MVAELGGIETDDLFAICDKFDRKRDWRDAFHFRPRAMTNQADQVSASISLCVGDKDTDELQRQIDAGGEVVIGPGDYTIKQLVLRSNLKLRLRNGTHLVSVKDVTGPTPRRRADERRSRSSRVLILLCIK